MTDVFAHRPVMVDEIVGVFATVPRGVVLDATLGAGGHSEALLDSRPDLLVVGVDRDPAAVVAASARLERFGRRFRVMHARFDDLHQLMPTDQIPRPTDEQLEQLDEIDAALHDGLSGALFDLGVSSPQLDEAERGFSFRHEGPLDMRMDPTARWTAADVVNGYPEDELARIIRRYGDERFAVRIAGAIVAARPIETTTQLAEIVTRAIPAATRRTGGHPATRTFQAIRIEVNGELDALPTALDAAIEATRPGGRISVLSYHSGEDRIVKDRFRTATGGLRLPAGAAVRVRRGADGAPRARGRQAPVAHRAGGQPARRIGPVAGGRADRAAHGRRQGRALT